MSVKYNFLENEPIGQDLFEGKSQERIAKVIVDIVKDEKFKVIGIDGGWGTGKSNLVKMVDGLLPDHKFFLYDVWGHQEDEQRKAILVELTDFITKEGSTIVNNKTNWEKNLEILLANTKETTTVNQPYLSVGFIFSLFSIVYVPTVNVFKDSIVDFFEIQALFWKLLLVLFPMVIVLGIYIYHLIREWYKKTGFWKAFKLSSQETFQVYTNRQKVDTRVETISENQPSVRDFRNWMTKIDNDLGENNLVLVFDNFDRLPKKHILSIWSVIHVFFAETKYKKIKIIIPFDRLHIKNAFKELNGTEKDYANDYINKTFDIIYRVAPPILSSWKLFFSDNWVKAFPNYDKAEYIKVEQAYEVFRPEITPRELIAFINEVVSLKLLNDAIPDRYIAIFVLNQEHIIAHPLKAITELDYLKSLDEFYHFDDDFQKFITALTFQIEPENALEVVYRKQLKNAFLNEDFESFNGLMETSVFSRIIYSVINELEDLKSPVLVLNQLSPNEQFSETLLLELWDIVFYKLKDKSSNNGLLEDYQKIVLQNVRLANRIQWLNEILTHLSEFEGFKSIYYSKAIDELETLNTSANLELDILGSLKSKKVSPDDFIELVDDKKNDYSRYKISCDDKNLDNHLVGVTMEDTLKINFLEFYSSPTKLVKFKSHLIKLATENKSNIKNLEKIIELLKLVSNDLIKPFLDDPELYSLMSQLDIKEPFYADLTAMKITLGVANHPNYQATYNKALQARDSSFNIRVSEKIKYYIDYDDCLIKSLEFDSPMLKSVIQLMIQPDYKQGDFNRINVLDNFNRLVTHNKLDGKLLFKKLDEGFKNDTPFAFEYVWSLTDDVFENAVQSETEIAKVLISVIISHFEVMNATNWKEKFQDLSSREFKVLKVLNYSSWNGFALEEFKDKLIEITSAGTTDNFETINFLLKSFEEGRKDLTNTFKDIRDKLILNGNITEEIFLNFGKWLFKYGGLDEKSADVLRTMIKTSFLDSEECLKLLLELSPEIKLLMSKAKNADYSDLVEGILARELNEKIQELAGALSVSFPRKKKDDDNTSDNN